MVYLKRFWSWITYPYTQWKVQRELKKRLEEAKKRDPFIYK